jgi:hypothetical protein
LFERDPNPALARADVYRSEDLGIDWRIILKWILRKSDSGIHLAEDRDQWRAVRNTVMKLAFLKRWGIS